MDVECPVCLEEYCSREVVRCVLPCREGHLICANCLKNIYEYDCYDTILGGECWLLGVNCNKDRPHARCPICRDVFHLPSEGINSVLTIPENQNDFDNLLQNRRKLRRNILKYSKHISSLGTETVEKLETLKIYLNNKTMDCRIAKLSGAVTGIVGGTLFIVGAALAIPTFGAAAPLMVAGAIVSGAGGATATGAAVADLAFTKQVQKETEELWALCQTEYAQLCDMIHQLQLQDSLIFLGVKCATSLGGTAGSLVGVIRLAALAADLSQDTAATLFRVAGVAGRVLHIAGLVLASALLVFDVISLVWNSVEIANRQPAAFSDKIDEVVQLIRTNCIDTTKSVESQLEEIDQNLLLKK